MVCHMEDSSQAEPGQRGPEVGLQGGAAGARLGRGSELEAGFRPGSQRPAVHIDWLILFPLLGCVTF